MKKYLTIFITVLVFVFCGWYVTDFAKKQNVVEKPIASVLYSCRGGEFIQAEYYKGKNVLTKPEERPVPTGSVRLKFSDGLTMNLWQTISADGGRYANMDESFVFWGKGNGVIVLENNKEKKYIGCIKVVPEPKGTNLAQIYTDPNGKFSLRFPEGYQTDTSYKYTINPEMVIDGVKFTIPSALARGTNLSSDSYISVESIPKTRRCMATLFYFSPLPSTEITDGDITYDVASSTGAGAGNRYEEIIYAFPYTNPCMSIRYFIHYMVFENYLTGTVKEFNKTSLLQEFDKIRSTFISK
jgi:membrane-bound inhibitor of C-type lysozyme